MIVYKRILYVCIAYWITRFIGLNYFVDYQSLDFVATLVTGVSLIGMLWITGGAGWGIALLVFLIPVFLLQWLFSHNYRPIREISEPVEYFVTEDKDIEVKGQDLNVRNSPEFMSTYKIYDKIVGPIYLKKKVLRARSESIDSVSAVESALNNPNL